MYYPSNEGVDKDAVMQQFVDQLLLREGYYRQLGNPCPPFELKRALKTIRKINVVRMPVKIFDNEEDGEISNEDDETIRDEENSDESKLCI